MQPAPLCTSRTFHPPSRWGSRAPARTRTQTGESACGPLQRPQELREVPAGSLPPGKPRLCSLSPGSPGELRTPHRTPHRELQDSVLPLADLRHSGEEVSVTFLLSLISPSSACSLAGENGVCPAADLGVWGQQVTCPHSWPTLARDRLQGTGWAPGSSGAGLHLACLWSGWRADGTPGTAAGLAPVLSKNCRRPRAPELSPRCFWPAGPLTGSPYTCPIHVPPSWRALPAKRSGPPCPGILRSIPTHPHPFQPGAKAHGRACAQRAHRSSQSKRAGPQPRMRTARCDRLAGATPRSLLRVPQDQMGCGGAVLGPPLTTLRLAP